jgi:hypothetical protein
MDPSTVWDRGSHHIRLFGMCPPMPTVTRLLRDHVALICVHRSDISEWLCSYAADLGSACLVLWGTPGTTGRLARSLRLAHRQLRPECRSGCRPPPYPYDPFFPKRLAMRRSVESTSPGYREPEGIVLIGVAQKHVRRVRAAKTIAGAVQLDAPANLREAFLFQSARLGLRVRLYQNRYVLAVPDPCLGSTAASESNGNSGQFFEGGRPEHLDLDRPERSNSSLAAKSSGRQDRFGPESSPEA